MSRLVLNHHMTKYSKFEQMAHEKAKGQQAEKLFLGSLRASRAIKKNIKKVY